MRDVENKDGCANDMVYLSRPAKPDLPQLFTGGSSDIFSLTEKG